jgi:hypothetical protein
MRSGGRESGWGSESGSGQGVQQSGGGGGGRGGGSSSGGQTIVQVSGKLNSNGQQQLAAFIGMGSAIGLYKLTSSGSSGIAASTY